MKLDRLILIDFITFDFLDYVFENRPLQVRGLNLTDDGQKTNGVGKSGLQTAIEYLMTGQSSRGVVDSELVTYGKKSSHIELFASCDVRKQNIHIDCTINKKGANVLVVKVKGYGEDWVDDNSQKVSTSSNNDTKKYVTNWFAISKEDLFNYYLINGSKFKSFFTSSNKEKVELINRFSDASIIDGLEQVDVSEFERVKLEADSNISRTEGKIEIFEEKILDEESRDFEKELSEEVELIEEEITEHEGEIVHIVENKKPNLEKRIGELKPKEDGLNELIGAQDELIKGFKKSLSKLNVKIDAARDVFEKSSDAVSDFESTDWDSIREKFDDDIIENNDNINNINKKLDEQRENSKKIKILLENLSVKLSGKIDCPKCSHEFLLDGDIDEAREKEFKAGVLEAKVSNIIEELGQQIEEEVSLRKDSEAEIQKINDKEKLERKALDLLVEEKYRCKEVVEDLVSQRGVLERKISKNKSIKDGYKNEISKLDSQNEIFKDLISKLADDIESEEGKISKLRGKIASLKPSNNKEVLRDLNEKIKSARAYISKQRKISEQAEESISNTVEWGLNFKRFKMYVANQSLETIEYHSNRYLKDMGSDMRVELSGSRELAKGDIKEEISAKIIRGVERSFKSFSGGERGRLIFASILANRHMINSTHPYGGLDFLSVDEVFEGVDSEGIKSIIESAKTLNVAIMIITHVTDSDTSSDILTIVKENDISRIKL